MGHQIRIGNAAPQDDGTFAVKHTEQARAPYWPSPQNDHDMSGNSNARYPSYGSMRYFGKVTGLRELFRELLYAPGCIELLEEHVEQVERARDRWQRRHPNAEPGWHADQDPTLAKLIWYAWWMRWAIEHCERPAIQNS